jgi:hypothetical protein
VKLRPGQPYLSIPLSMCVDEKTLTSGAHAPPHFAQFWTWLTQQRDAPTAPNQLLLAVYLIWARWVAVPGSAENYWEPYVDLLPRKLQTPEHTWTDGDFDLLDGLPRLRADVKRQRAKRWAEFQWIEERVSKGQAATFGAKLLPSWALTRGRWSWAMGILNTRMIWWDGGPHLVPLLDMVNCDAPPEGNQLHVHQTVREGDRAVTRAGWPFNKGDEITENYGQHNYYYFSQHGFFLPSNPHECYMLDIPPVTRDVTRRALFLTRFNLEKDESQVCFSLQNTRRLQTAIDVARVYSLPDKVLETAILKRELPARDSDRQTRRVLRFLGKAILKQQKAVMEQTIERFDSREPEMLDAPHKDMIHDYADSIGRRMEDDRDELRRRVKLLTERIRVRESREAREKIEQDKQQQKLQHQQDEKEEQQQEAEGEMASLVGETSSSGADEKAKREALLKEADAMKDPYGLKTGGASSGRKEAAAPRRKVKKVPVEKIVDDF